MREYSTLLVTEERASCVETLLNKIVKDRFSSVRRRLTLVVSLSSRRSDSSETELLIDLSEHDFEGGYISETNYRLPRCKARPLQDRVP